jgi:hypothetical protein
MIWQFAAGVELRSENRPGGKPFRSLNIVESIGLETVDKLTVALDN